MVWIKLIISFFIILTSVNASELSQEEINYFKIIDLNNDGFVSIDEINQSTGIIFQLIDINKDNKISLLELKELKEIIEILK
jgi:Ca2+-binding EF-hand superfamily protein